VRAALALRRWDGKGRVLLVQTHCLTLVGCVDVAWGGSEGILNLSKEVHTRAWSALSSTRPSFVSCRLLRMKQRRSVLALLRLCTASLVLVMVAKVLVEVEALNYRLEIRILDDVNLLADLLLLLSQFRLVLCLKSLQKLLLLKQLLKRRAATSKAQSLQLVQLAELI
jgi:hypothetical protein